MTIIQKFLVCIKFGVNDQRDITYRSVCCVNNLVNLKFKDHFLINASADIPIAIHIPDSRKQCYYSENQKFDFLKSQLLTCRICF